jgi:hypothetical protein
MFDVSHAFSIELCVCVQAPVSILPDCYVAPLMELCVHIFLPTGCKLLDWL